MGLDISNPISSIADVAKLVLGRVLPDKAAKDAANAQLDQMQLSGELAQIAGQLDIDKTEAQSTNWWVSGWRAGVGWVCVVGLLSQFVVRPYAIFFAGLFHRTDVAATFPALDLSTLMTLVFSMLGIGIHEKLTS